GEDALHRPAGRPGEHRTPGGVPAADGVEGGGQPGDVEISGQPAAGIHVPGGQEGVLLVQAPQPLLVEGEGPVAGPGRTGDPADLGGRRRSWRGLVRGLLLAQQLEESPLLRGQAGQPVGHVRPIHRRLPPSSSSIARASSGERPSTWASSASRLSSSSPRARRTVPASPAMAGVSNRAVTGSSTSSRWRTRVRIWIASSEWPPRSRKLSSIPTGTIPNSSS